MRPHSVVDVGCGTCGWLAEFVALGVSDVLGVDSEAPARLIEVPKDKFVRRDLAHPFTLGRTFDLALSLEVAEHLPPTAAEPFVTSLCALAPVILFSAAVPGQGGTHHLNEQWPAYWIEIFRRHGFAAIDAIRSRVWENPNVAWWYAQNTFLFVSEERLESDALLRTAHREAQAIPTAIVHPEAFAMLTHLSTWQSFRDRFLSRVLGKLMR